MVHDLNQHSHSDDFLELLHKVHPPLVRKVFRTNLDRVVLNIEKQRLFPNILTGEARLSAAEVVRFNVYKDSAELIMPYIQGITGHMFAVQSTCNLAQTLSSSLSTMLIKELGESRETLVSTDIFRDKLVLVSASTQDLHLRRLVDTCQTIIKSLPAMMPFPMGSCHGDLTLSNLIFDPIQGITLIDFLHTYLESPLQDVAKLKQDFVYGWSFRKDSSALRIKAEIFCRHNLPQAIVQIEKKYPTQVHLLTLITLARIAPYVKDDVTNRWLIQSLTDCLRDFSK